MASPLDPLPEPAYPIGRGKDPRVPLQVEQAPRSLNYSEVTWDIIMSILRQAERGATERWADLTRRMLTDGHLASCVETRKLAVCVAKLAVEPVDSDDEIDVRGAADAQRMLDELPTSRIKRDMADGIHVGWSCLEIKWEARGAWLWPAAVEWNHPRRFRFGWDFKPYIYDDGRAAADMGKLSPEERARCRSLNIEGMPLDPYRWIVHMPRAFPDYPQMGGVLLSAVRAWWIKAAALRYQLAGAEMAGNGRVLGKQDPNADEATKAAFLENLANWGASGVMTCSPGADVVFTAPLAQGASSVWSTLIAEMNGEESKAVLGSTLAVDVGTTGSRAVADTQKSVTIDPRAEVDEDEIRHTLHRDLVDVFLELNRWAYGGRKPNVRTRSVWVEEDAPQVDELLVKAGIVTKNQLLASRGLPALSNGGDDFVTLPDAAMPGFGAPTPEVASLPVSADGTPVAAVADTALNGAQVTSLGAIMEQLAAGTLAAETAVLFITSSFPSIPEERARRMVEAQAALAAPVVADPALAQTAAPPPLAPESRWTDTADGHRLVVKSTAGGLVYFVDLDYEDPKSGPMPGRQWAWKEATFRERTVPTAPEVAPGGASAALPLPDGREDGGEAADGALSSEAHGDLWALSDADRPAALASIGHPGLLTAQAMLDGVPLFELMRSSLIDACGKATGTATLASALATWVKRKNAPLTEQLRETNLHARMAGALFVAQYEVPEAFGAGPVALDRAPVPPFLALPFDEAIAAFEARRVVSPEEFEAMDADARAEAFTATRLAHETLVQRARDLLLRTLRDGGTFEEFRRALVEDESALGVTPSSPWYLETVYRTNVQMAYGAGRLELLTSPAVAAVRPYLERRTARDDRVRESHAALEGALFPQSDEALVAAYSPPYLDGELQFNCRCVLVARRASDVDTSRVFTG